MGIFGSYLNQGQNIFASVTNDFNVLSAKVKRVNRDSRSVESYARDLIFLADKAVELFTSRDAEWPFKGRRTVDGLDPRDSFFWAIKMERYSTTHPDIEATPFPPLGGWMPITDYLLTDWTLDQESVDVRLGFGIDLPSRKRLPSKLLLTFIETQDRKIYEWKKKYLEAMAPESLKTLHYKESVIKITLYQYERDSSLLEVRNFLCTPNLTQTSSGGNSSKTETYEVEFNILGEVIENDIDSSTQSTSIGDKLLRAASLSTSRLF